MRPLECALLVLSAAASVVVAVSPPVPFAIKALALVGQLLPGALHLLFEGARWQMYAAYGAGALNTGALAATVRGAVELPLAARVALPAAALLLLAASTALAALLPVLGPGMYPALGPYRVGARYVHSAAAYKDDRLGRELSGLLFYPSAPAAGSGSESAVLVPEGTFISDAVARFAKMPAFIFSHMRLFRMPAAMDAPLLQAHPPPDGRLPVVLLLHGLGGFRGVYSALALGLASRGFLVLALDHTDGSAAAVRYPSGRVRAYEVPAEPQESHEEIWHRFRGRQLQERVEDVRAAWHYLEALDSDAGPLPDFRGRLDLQRTALVGHSFGACTALAACHALHPTFSAGVGLDVWMYPAWGNEPLLLRDGPLVPFAFVDSEKWVYEPNEARTQEIFERSPTGSLRATLRGAGHQSFSDFGLFAGFVLRRMRQVGEVDARGALATTAAFAAAFIRRHALKERGEEPLLDGPPEGRPPELLLGPVL